MLSNAYFLAKFRFDTAENEPAKNLQNFAAFLNFANPSPSPTNLGRPLRRPALRDDANARARGRSREVPEPRLARGPVG